MPQVVTPPKPKKSALVSEDIGKFGMWVNDNIVGNAFTFVLAIIAVLIVYAAIPFVGGYGAWNTGLGLFFNTLSSSFELITGIGAVVGVVVLHRKVKNHVTESAQRHADLLDMHETHAREVAALHEKVDQVIQATKQP